MPNAVVTLKKGAGRTLKQGGPWIYDNEVESIMGSFTDGDIVLVHDFDGYPMGRGFINRNSKLIVRMMTRDRDTEVDESFIRMRVKNAWEYRKKVMDDVSSCRVIFGEADFLPGLVVDKFADVLVVESLALGIDRFKGMIVDILKELMEADGIHIRGVYERSDAKVREQEGMERQKGFIGEPFDTKVEIVENGVRYYVDVKDGQKTGFFLDQKYNRRAAAKLCRGSRVLDCFTHTGSFALNAGMAGAEHVTGVDASELGVAQARENAGAERFGGPGGIHLRGCVRSSSEAGEAGGEVRRGDPGSARVYKVQKFDQKSSEGIQRDQSAGNEACEGRRISCHLFVFSFHGPGALYQNHRTGCAECA